MSFRTCNASRFVTVSMTKKIKWVYIIPIFEKRVIGSSSHSSKHDPPYPNLSVYQLNEPTTLMRISRAQRVVRLICGGFITSSRARTNRAILIRS